MEHEVSGNAKDWVDTSRMASRRRFQRTFEREIWEDLDREDSA